MDLLNLKPQLEAVIPVIDPLSYDGEYKYGVGTPVEGMFYALASKASPEFRAAARAADELTDPEDKGIALFAGAITRLGGFEEGGVTLDCNMKTKQRLLREYDWWLEQVIVTLRGREAFLPNARNACALSPPSALGVQPKSAK